MTKKTLSASSQKVQDAFQDKDFSYQVFEIERKKNSLLDLEFALRFIQRRAIQLQTKALHLVESRRPHPQRRSPSAAE
jgi:ABC-type oligopeptide transport system ATPase subunit